MVIYSILMNIAGTEWFIIIFLLIVLFLGSKSLPSFSRTIGRGAMEYQKARKSIEKEMSMTTNSIIGPVISPVSSEREKLESIAKSLGIDFQNLSDNSLRRLIARKMKEMG